MNSQAPEKVIHGNGGSMLDVHSIFYTLQGEGPFSGNPSVFIRLAGCNLQCPLCDTDYTKGRQLQTVATLLANVRKAFPESNRFGRRLVVITGGEPFRQNLSALIDGLMDESYCVQIETNGVLPPSFDLAHAACSDEISLMGVGVYVVVSPKAGKVNAATASCAVAWKYVGDHTNLSEEDGLPMAALEHPNHPRLARPTGAGSRLVYLQPTDFTFSVKAEGYLEHLALKDKNDQATQACVQSCLKHGYRLQLQTHKIVRVP